LNGDFAKATITFDRRGRSALPRTRPQPRVIDLRHAETAWGDVALTAKRDDGPLPRTLATGTAVGKSARYGPMMADHWRKNAGFIPPNFSPPSGTNASRGWLKCLATRMGWIWGHQREGREKMSIGFIPLRPCAQIILPEARQRPQAAAARIICCPVGAQSSAAITVFLTASIIPRRMARVRV